MKCVNCNHTAFYENDDIASVGGSGPDLLPGTGLGIFSHAKFSLKICAKCRYVHWFVKQKDMHRVEGSRKFTYKEYLE